MSLLRRLPPFDRRKRKNGVQRELHDQQDHDEKTAVRQRVDAAAEVADNLDSRIQQLRDLARLVDLGREG